MDAGASVLTFFGVAIQSTKMIYEFVKLYKEAPQRVKSLAFDLENLEAILTQFEVCKILRDPANVQAINFDGRSVSEWA
jgi:hypothetical protein